MQALIDYRQHTEHQARLRVDLELGLLVVLVGLIFFIRITNIGYNTLFVDEAANVTGGRDLLAGLTDRHIMSWFGGSFLYPVAVTLIANVSGVVGMRLLSAVLMTGAAIFVYLATRRLFGRKAAFWGLLIYGLASGSISLGQFAVYDVPMLPLLAATSFCLIAAAAGSRRSGKLFLVLGAAAFCLSVASKYTALLYLPALVLTAFAIYGIQHRLRDVGHLIVFFLIPVMVVLGGLTLYFFNDLRQVFTGTAVFQIAPRWEIVQTVSSEIGITTLVALLGMGALIFSAWRRSTAESAAVGGMLHNYLRPKRRTRLVLVIAAAIILFTAYLSVPLYQILSSNIRSVWKAAYASLIFLAPLAAYMLAQVVEWVQQSNRKRFAAALLTTLLVVAWASYDLDRVWGFQNSWPNVSGAVAYLRQHGLTRDSRVLAEQGAVYEYYFYDDFGLDGRRIWADTYFMDYQGLQGVDAMTKAIADHYFNFVALDDSLSPDVNVQLEAALQQAGYTIDYRDIQKTTTRDVTVVRIYARPLDAGG